MRITLIGSGNVATTMGRKIYQSGHIIHQVYSKTPGHAAHLAEQLGIGYQLRDDLLGVFGESVQTGKSTSTDIKEGKRTVLVEQFDTLATQGQFERFYELFHRDSLTDQETNEAKQLLDDSGAKKAVEDMIKNIELQSKALIDTLSIDKVARGRFQQLINDCLNREV